MLAPEKLGGFMHHAEKVSGRVNRERSESFSDHYSQATLFWNSMSPPEKQHLVLAARFELGKVESKEVRQRMIDQFAKVDIKFAKMVAEGIGVPAPVGVAAAVQKVAEAVKEAVSDRLTVERSDAISMANTVKDTIKTRRIAILAADGVSGADVTQVKAALTAQGAHPEIVSLSLGSITSVEGDAIEVDKSLLHVGSIMYDAVFVPGGAASVSALSGDGDAIHFMNEAFRHAKPISALGEGIELLLVSSIRGVTLAGAGAPDEVVCDKGVVTARSAPDRRTFIDGLVQAIAAHRHWDRDAAARVPA